MKYEQLVKDILLNIGGKDNINSVTHCITRLRFKLKDVDKANTQVIKNLPGVVTVMISGGQYQVVIGNHVPDVYKDFLTVAGIQGDFVSQESGPKGSPLDRFIDIISGVFQPVLGILCATGMIKGLLGILTATNLITNVSGTYIVLNAIGDCLFYFFPIFLGFTAAKKFNINQFYGMTIGAALVYPAIGALGQSAEILNVLFEGTIFESTVQSTFLGIPLIVPQQGYTSTVIPVIVAVACAAPLERFLRRIIPDVVKTFLVPFFTFLIIIPVTFLIIGPVTTILSSMLGNAVLSLYNLSPALMGVIVGGFWQILVIFGLHWGLIPIMINNILTLQFDTIVVTSFAASFAQTGVVIAIFLKTRNKNLKSLTIPSIISGFFGVTEPAIYGITLPRKITFVASCIVSAIGGGILGFFNVKSFMMGGLGVFGYPTYRSLETGQSYIPLVILVTVGATLLGILAGYLTYKPEIDDPVDNGLGTKPDTVTPAIASAKETTVISPINGNVVPLNEIEDAAFASGVIGKGVAIIPTQGKLFAPFSGTITTLFPTKHAIGITSDDGIELLIHVGMDTVQLDGKHFTAHVNQGDHVKKGQLLEEFDIKGIQADGFSVVTPVVVTNHDDYLDIVESDKKTVSSIDTLLYIIKR